MSLPAIAKEARVAATTMYWVKWPEI